MDRPCRAPSARHWSSAICTHVEPAPLIVGPRRLRAAGATADAAWRARDQHGRGAASADDRASAEPPVHVVGGARVVGCSKICVGRCPSRRRTRARSRRRGRTRRMLRHALGLLHVVRDDHDRDVVARARRSSPRCAGSTSGRAPSTARPSAARRAAPRASGRCTAAAAGRPTARRRASPSRFLTSFHRPARRRHSSTSDVVARAPAGPTGLSPASTFSVMDIAGNGFGFWNTMPMRRRISIGR